MIGFTHQYPCILWFSFSCPFNYLILTSIDAGFFVMFHFGNMYRVFGGSFSWVFIHTRTLTREPYAQQEVNAHATMMIKKISLSSKMICHLLICSWHQLRTRLTKKQSNRKEGVHVKLNWTQTHRSQNYQKHAQYALALACWWSMQPLHSVLMLFFVQFVFESVRFRITRLFGQSLLFVCEWANEWMRVCARCECECM